MLHEFIFIIAFLLPVAWYFGYRRGSSYSKTKVSNRNVSLSGKYFAGLNYLLNEESDKAIDTFVSMLEVDSDTVETHLALGNLFRRRGEVHKAIRIHQNLIARPALTTEHKKMALMELGYDYMTAGLLDRAEKIFKDLVNVKPHRKASLKQLLLVYQSTKDWQSAIGVAEKLKPIDDSNWDNQIAHFYCEMADLSLADKLHKEAINYAKKALSVFSGHVRAILLMADTYYQLNDFKRAQKFYKELLRQNATFVCEAIDKITDTYIQLKDSKSFQAFLDSAVDRGAGNSVMLKNAEEIQQSHGDIQAAEYIVSQMTNKPSIKGLLKLIDLHLKHASSSAQPSLKMLQSVVVKLLENKPVYHCDSCGFDSKTLFWQCPSCKNWGSVKPIQGIEGE